MKRIPALALTAALLLGPTAYAAGGSASDPLVSQDYVSGSYQTELSEQIDQKIETAVAATYQKVLSKLGMGDGVSYINSQKCARGDTITLGQGSVLVFQAGTASVKVSGGQIIDVTDGTASAELGLAEGHRYIVGEQATATIEILSDAALLFWEGSVSSDPSGAEVTPFTDLVLTDWYYSYACYAYVQGLFTGVNNNTFAPKSAVTRAMLATVLYRLAGEPDTDGQSSFTDVPPDQWYSGPVAWAEDEEVVNGVGEGCYAPANRLTREQMAVMLYNYAAKNLQYNVTTKGSLDRFPDAGAVSDWAQEAVLWAVERGILSGRDTGMLDPAGTATRAEVSAMFQRFSEAYDKK